MGLEAAELARWTRFAAKGGIGRCIALCDCVAESQDDLMFLKDDEITVLFQIPELEGTYLGYCEGVVGRFLGAHVRFLTKLKKPVMTKRASVSAASVVSVGSSAGGGKSPTPTPTGLGAADARAAGGGGGGGKSPSPAFGAGAGQGRRSSTSTSHSHSLERRGSTPRVMSPLSTSLSMSASTGVEWERSQQQRHTHTSFTSSSPSSPSRVDSPGVYHEPALRSASTKPVTMPSLSTVAGYDSPTPASPTSPTSPISAAAAAAFPLPPTSAPPPPPPTFSVSQPPISQQQQHQQQNQQQRYTAHAPAPLNLNLNLRPNTLSIDQASGTSPLRIMKRSPTSPPAASPFALPHVGASSFAGLHLPVSGSGSSSSAMYTTPSTMTSASTTTPHPHTPTSAASFSASVYSNGTSVYSERSLQDPSRPLDPSSSSFSFSDADKTARLGDGADEGGEVGIGMSLLRGLEGLGGDSDSESDSDLDSDAAFGFDGRGAREHRVERAGEGGDKGGDASSDDGSVYNDSQEGTVEGLGYALSLDGHGVGGGRRDEVAEVREEEEEEERVLPSEAEHKHRQDAAEAEEDEEGQEILAPLPPPHQPYAHHHHHHSSGTTATASPTSPSFTHVDPHRKRGLSRASLAPSVSGQSVAASTTSATSGASGSWEGAGDIYDDYRYSRYSVGSKMSRVSVLGGAGGEVEREREEEPPVPDDVRARSDSLQGVKRGVHKEEEEDGRRDIVQGRHEQDVKEDEEDDTHTPSRNTGKRSTLLKNRTMSVDSDASVYTQNSRLSGMSIVQDVGGLAALGLSAAPTAAVAESVTPSGHTRPPPLNLTKAKSADAATAAIGAGPGPDVVRSPLLNTTWGSPLSSPDYASVASPKSSAALYTPVPGAVGAARGGYAVENDAEEVARGGGPRSPLLAVSPTFGGFASQMRMRLEEERRSPNPERTEFGAAPQEEEGDVSARTDQDKSGLGHRIVVEDEDELPSRILNNSTLNDSPSSSPEPELAEETLMLAGKHLAPLVVANRSTPSPVGSVVEGGSEEGDLSGAGLAGRLRSLEQEDEEKEQQKEEEEESTKSADITLSPSLSPSHLRPSLRELREGGTVLVPGTNQRRSLFLPHPNAPKAPVGAETAGPMYIAAQQGPPPPQQQQQQQGHYLQPGQQHQQRGPPPPQQHQQQPQQWNGPPPYQQPQPRPHLFAVIRMALALPPRSAVPPPPAGQPARPTMPLRGPTIYGRTEVDLGAATGPVPIVFSVEPPLASAPPHGQGVGKGQGPRVQMMARNQQAARSKSVGPGVGHANAAGPGPGALRGSVGAPPPIPPPGGAAGNVNEQKPPGGGGVIPRANFFPKAPGLRPRSRSFSGFNSTTVDAPVPVQRSLEESEVLSASAIKRSLTKTTSLSVLNPSSSPSPSSSTSTSSPPASSSTSSTSLSPPQSTSLSPPQSTSLSPPQSTSPPSTTTNTPAAGPAPSASQQSKLSLTASPLRPSPLSLSSIKPATPSPTSPSAPAPLSPLMQGMKPPLSPGMGMKPPSSPLAQSVTFPTNVQGPSAGAGSRATSPTELGVPVTPSFGSMRGVQAQGLGQGLSLGQGQGVGSGQRSMSASNSTLNAGTNASTSTSTSISTTSISPPFASSSAPGRTASLQALPVSRNLDRDAASVWSMRAQLPPSSQGLAPPSSSSSSSPALAASTLSTGSGGPPVARQTSLRSKLSLPNLRRKQSRLDDDAASSYNVNLGANSNSNSNPHSNSNANSHSNSNSNPSAHEDSMMHMLQVQDMEFELVRPSHHFSREAGAARGSEDSGVLGSSAAPGRDGREGSFDSVHGPSPGGGGGGFLRAGSPAMSVASGSAAGRARSPVGDFSSNASSGTPGPGHNSWIPQIRGPPPQQQQQDAESMDAHRQRELKWMSIVSAASGASGGSGGASSISPSVVGVGPPPSSSASASSLGGSPSSGSVLSSASPFSSNLNSASNSNSTPTSSADVNAAAALRKSKKVRKLLLDGVPASVRYLVWSFLTDGKGRCVPGVYAQLGARGWGRSGTGTAGKEREAIREEMERDVREVVRGANAGMGVSAGAGAEGEVGERGERREREVLGLLQAYLNMVPDVVYSKGLAQIVSLLLLLSPEEDAFWIFVSMMDAHLRPYFSASRLGAGAENTLQMEVDATLLSRALEANDSVLAKKLFADAGGMGLRASRVCAPWFSALFVGVLPPEYLHRVWDLFLFDGVPFLIRTALALLTCCRRALLECTSEAQVLQTLARPPQAWLPAAPDGFLALAFGMKMKDDEVRKQRLKMEAAMKRQTQSQSQGQTGGGGGGLGFGLGLGLGGAKPRVASVGGVGVISLPRM